MTNWTNINNVTDMVTEANKTTPFWLGILVLIFGVLLISFMKFGFIIAWLGASFLAFVLGIFMAYLGAVAWSWVLMFLGFLIVGFLYVIIWGRE